MSLIRLGYVGCGYMAQKVHLPNFLSIPDCEVVALAEVRQELGRRVQSRLRIPKLYPDHEALLADPEIDAVAVSAAFALQGHIARDALLAGKDVFMEKPMAVSLRQADAILAASRQSGKRLMVGYMKRYDAGNELVKAQVEAFKASGEIGAITYARNHGFCGDWIAGLDTPMEQSDEPMPQSASTGPEWLPPEFFSQYINYLQQYTHNINLLRWFLDAGDQASVRVVDFDPDGYTGVVILDLAGTRAVLESGRISHYRWDEHTQIYFQHGWIHTWAPPLLLKQVPAEVEIYRAGKEQTFARPVPQPAWSWSYKREAEHFIHCLQTGEPFRSSAEDTRTDVRLFEEIFQAYLAQRNLVH
ncbi:MAG TPA: Gfo/Idh/MocA family oxidoreductase [Caldilineaceae bacterium]|nr:Gfo/Idh/MocA family oxidoreductase [Caldilineaceae bacterium]